MVAQPPEPQPRCKFATYLFERRITNRDAARALGCSYEQVRRICLPFVDEDWRRPSEKLRQKVAAWTGGEIALTDWQEPPVRVRVAGVAQ